MCVRTLVNTYTKLIGKERYSCIDNTWCSVTLLLLLLLLLLCCSVLRAIKLVSFDMHAKAIVCTYNVALADCNACYGKLKWQ
jgi:hypothetical protein